MLTNGRILLVDDEPLVLEMFETFFSKEGYDVFVASNANDALLQIEKSYFDALICDVMLEDLDGFDLLQIARKKNSSVAVILITGAPSDLDAKRAEELGVVYLSKPIGFDLLLSKVQSQLLNTKDQRAKIAQAV